MATAAARYTVRIPSIVVRKEGETSPMFTIDENGITWHNMRYGQTVMLQEALFNAPIALGKVMAASLEE